MSTTFNAPIDSLYWTRLLKGHPAARRPITGSATHAGATPITDDRPALRVTPELIRAAAARAHAERNAAFHRAFMRLFSRPSTANIEL
jgi:hypothetical protein